MRKRIKLPIYIQTLATLLLLLQSAVIADEPPGIPDGWSDGYVYANGIRIHYYHAVPAADKPVMVMIHGVTDIGLNWTTLTWKLQDDYDIYMVDTRGHGLSDPYTPADDSLTLIKDVVEFVKVMNFEKPILMGHSMGAATVMRLGAFYPDLAKAIIMLDPFLGQRPRRRAAPPSQKKKEEQDQDNFSLVMFGTPEQLVAQNNHNFDDLVTICCEQTPKWDLVDCKYWALSKKQYHGHYSQKSWQSVRGIMNSEDAMAKIQVPVLILKADATAEARKEHQEAARVMPNGKLVHIDGAGHNLHHDELQQMMKVLTEFLSTL